MRRILRLLTPWRCLILGAALLLPRASAGEAKWWNPDFHYRVAATVDSGMYEREDALAHVEVRFPELFAQLGLGDKAALDRHSVRVVEYDDKGQVVAERASNVLPAAQGAAEAKGDMIVWRLAGKTEVLTDRLFCIYFDTAANGVKKKPNYPDVPCPDGNIPGMNLVKNPGFEEADPQKDWLPAHWNVFPAKEADSRQAQRSADFARTGKWSGKLAGESDLRFVQEVPVKPHKRYVMSGWVKVPSNTAGLAGCLTIWYGGPAVSPDVSNYKVQIDIKGVTDWMQLTGSGCWHDRPKGGGEWTLDTLPGTSVASIELFQAKGAVEYFDDIEIKELVPGGFMDVHLGKPEKRS